MNVYSIYKSNKKNLKICNANTIDTILNKAKKKKRYQLVWIRLFEVQKKAAHQESIV
jgi:hypothetical protein